MLQVICMVWCIIDVHSWPNSTFGRNNINVWTFVMTRPWSVTSFSWWQAECVLLVISAGSLSTMPSHSCIAWRTIIQSATVCWSSPHKSLFNCPLTPLVACHTRQPWWGGKLETKMLNRLEFYWTVMTYWIAVLSETVLTWLLCLRLQIAYFWPSEKGAGSTLSPSVKHSHIPDGAGLGVLP